VHQGFPMLGEEDKDKVQVDLGDHKMDKSVYELLFFRIDRDIARIQGHELHYNVEVIVVVYGFLGIVQMCSNLFFFDSHIYLIVL
jgi:hypothetical protein